MYQQLGKEFSAKIERICHLPCIKMLLPCIRNMSCWQLEWNHVPNWQLRRQLFVLCWIGYVFLFWLAYQLERLVSNTRLSQNVCKTAEKAVMRHSSLDLYCSSADCWLIAQGSLITWNEQMFWCWTNPQRSNCYEAHRVTWVYEWIFTVNKWQKDIYM